MCIFLVMVGDEERVVQAFVSWLHDKGWSASTEVEFCDVVATRMGHTMYAEAKGRTKATGLDVDTMFGQLLRRMPPSEVGVATFAVVVPDVALPAVLRVPRRVREILGIEVYTVNESGAVERHIS